MAEAALVAEDIYKSFGPLEVLKGVSLTAQQPINNVVRTALQGLAAVLGGTQSLHTNALDETLALPTEENARTALRTQQISAHQTGVTNSIDPLGGSYRAAELTQRSGE